MRLGAICGCLNLAGDVDADPTLAVSGAEAPVSHIQLPFLRLRRWVFFTFVLGTATGGSWMMLGIVDESGLSTLELAFLCLFAPTFAWISISFWSAVFGFLLGVTGRNPLTLERLDARPGVRKAAGSRTALVMLTHNDDPARVTSGLEATLRSLASTGQDEWFDAFLLSDTTDARMIPIEESAWEDLRQRSPFPERMIYRRRAANTARKSGNLADFCERWGSAYSFMVVLDSDSIMTGDALVELVEMMEANPGAGLIQTVPIPARQESLFGRLLQFGACIHSTLHAAGQSFWQADTANYWGHNAIIRLTAFRKECRLPVLPGSPPLGGEILSHDFVEAALLSRAGWSVYLATSITGSFEEVPEHVLDYSLRDRRWAQGSLQHLRLVFMRGLRPLSRLHFVMGAMGYLSSVLWLLMLFAGSAYVILAESGDPTSGSGEGVLSVPWPMPMGDPPIPLLAVTATLLFLPKALALILGYGRGTDRFGGPLRFTFSAFLEAAFAVTLAPILMAYHARFVASILLGRDVPWDGGSVGAELVPWPVAWKATAGIAALGVAWASLIAYSSWTFLLWLSPIFAGLLLAPVLVRWTSSPKIGEASRAAGLLLVPSETDPTHVTRGCDPHSAEAACWAQSPRSTGTATIEPYSVQEPS